MSHNVLVRIFIAVIVFNSIASCSVSSPAVVSNSRPAEFVADVPATSARLSGATFITNDIEASIDFYQGALNFNLLSRRELVSAESVEVFGLPEGSTITYAALVPQSATPTTPRAGINFAQIDNAAANPRPPSAKRTPEYGELVMAFSVTGIDDIIAKLVAKNVTVLVPAGISGTGRSKTITLMDPNGIRVQLYEIFPAQ